ncbi:hypothetical protein R1flu_013723 [Riccia fluitans]|uniref:Uncharacterized protein n=1 Tax=Riccia fluitans TaxID=41844 RepID=A0ABD1YH82_9MARC
MAVKSTIIRIVATKLLKKSPSHRLLNRQAAAVEKISEIMTSHYKRTMPTKNEGREQRSESATSTHRKQWQCDYKWTVSLLSEQRPSQNPSSTADHEFHHITNSESP